MDSIPPRSVPPLPTRHLRLVEPRPADPFDRLAANDDGVDPDEQMRQAIFAEIRDGLIWLGWGALAAMIFGVAYLYGAHS